jgi:hypothetical protein
MVNEHSSVEKSSGGVLFSTWAEEDGKERSIIHRHHPIIVALMVLHVNMWWIGSLLGVALVFAQHTTFSSNTNQSRLNYA